MTIIETERNNRVCAIIYAYGFISSRITLHPVLISRCRRKEWIIFIRLLEFFFFIFLLYRSKSFVSWNLNEFVVYVTTTEKLAKSVDDQFGFWKIQTQSISCNFYFCSVAHVPCTSSRFNFPQMDKHPQSNNYICLARKYVFLRFDKCVHVYVSTLFKHRLKIVRFDVTLSPTEYYHWQASKGSELKGSDRERDRRKEKVHAISWKR